jgi:hypothetical protein
VTVEQPILARPSVRRLSARVDADVFPIAAVALLALFPILAASGVVGSDSWLTLLAGRTIVDGGLPHHDTLVAMAHGADWVDQQWLAQLAFYALWAAGGIKLPALASVGLLVGSFASLVVLARRFGGSANAATVVAVPCFLAAVPAGGMRAQVLALGLYAILLWLLYGELRAPGRGVYLTLPLLVLWANIHGSAILGAGLVALLGATLWRRAPAKAATLVVLPWPLLLASPYAPSLPDYYRRLLANPAFTRLVEEWQPSTIRSQTVFFVLALGGLVLVARYGGRLTSFDRLAFVATLVGGLLAQRNVVWFALLALVVLPRTVDQVWTAPPAERRPGLNVALAAGAVAVACVAAVATVARSASWFLASYPVEAADRAAAAAGATGKVLADERYADWLLWRHPGLAGRVAYDARLELLTGEQIDEIARFWSGDGSGFPGYPVVVGRNSSDAVVALAAAGARVLYDENGVVVLRRAP